MDSSSSFVTVLLMLTLASKGVLSCRAYCKVTQIKCLKATHERNWGITWGKELFKQAQYAATTEVEQMSSFSAAESQNDSEMDAMSATIRIRHIIPDFAMRTEVCRHYLQTYRKTIGNRFQGGKVGCGVDWNDTFIVVHCLYKVSSQ